MTLALGYFAAFKWADTVLLEGSAEDLRGLAAQVRAFDDENTPPLLLHEGAFMPNGHLVRLAGSASAEDAAHGYVWLWSAAKRFSIAVALDTLASASAAHQYFDLVGTEVQLLVSHGEYGEAWWRSVE